MRAGAGREVLFEKSRRLRSLTKSHPLIVDRRSLADFQRSRARSSARLIPLRTTWRHRRQKTRPQRRVVAPLDCVALFCRADLLTRMQTGRLGLADGPQQFHSSLRPAGCCLRARQIMLCAPLSALLAACCNVSLRYFPCLGAFFFVLFFVFTKF